MGEAIGHLIWNMLNERSAEGNVQELLAAADAEHRPICSEKTVQDSELERGSPILGRDCVMSMICAVEPRIDVERAAGHHQSVEQFEIVVRQLDFMGQGNRQTTGTADRSAIVFADRVPGQVRKTARWFGVQGQAYTRTAWKFGQDCLLLNVIPYVRRARAERNAVDLSLDTLTISS